MKTQKFVESRKYVVTWCGGKLPYAVWDGKKIIARFRSENMANAYSARQNQITKELLRRLDD